MNTYTFSFRVRGGQFDPNQLDDDLGLSARHKRRLGDIIVDSSGNQVGIEPRSYWSFTPHLLKDDDLIGELQRFVASLESRKTILTRLSELGAKCEIFVGFRAEKSVGEEFPSELLIRLGALNIALSFDCYFSAAEKDLSK